jgi:hypothetical protein
MAAPEEVPMHAGPPLAVTLGAAALVLVGGPAAAHEDATPSPSATAPSAVPPSADPHAGHAGHTAPTPTAADPHAAHAGHGAEPRLVTPSDLPRAEVLTGFGVVNAGIVVAGLLVRRHDATHRRARRLS